MCVHFHLVSPGTSAHHWSTHYIGSPLYYRLAFYRWLNIYSRKEINNALENKADLVCPKFIKGKRLHASALYRNVYICVSAYVDLIGYLIQICECVYVSIREHYLWHTGEISQVILKPSVQLLLLASPCSFLIWCRCTFVTNVVNFWFVAWGSGFHMQASVLIILE